MANGYNISWRTLKGLIEQLTDEELDAIIQSHNNEDGIWCYPVAIRVERVDGCLEVTLDDGYELPMIDRE